MEREKINWEEIIKAGNTVKVRQWDDMKREFGVTFDGAKIDCFKKFTKCMKTYCGKTIEITKNMEKNFNKHGYFYYEGSMFSADMLEPYVVHEEEKGGHIMERERINWKEIIKEGNIVKVRQWEDMAKEYGEYYSANKPVINCSKTFTKDMEKYCGEIIEITKNMEKKFNECGYFYYEDYVFSTDMLEPYEEELDVINIPVKDEYLKDSHEEKQEKEISYLEKEWGIKDNAIYVMEYNDTIEKTFLGENNIITFKGKIINFTNDKCFIVDEKRGLAILSIQNIISMIPIRIIS